MKSIKKSSHKCRLRKFSPMVCFSAHLSTALRETLRVLQIGFVITTMSPVFSCQAQVASGFDSKITDDAFWKVHRVCVIRVIKVLEETETEDSQVIVEGVLTFDGAVMPQRHNMSIHSLEFYHSAFSLSAEPEYQEGGRGRVAPPQLRVGDLVLVFSEPSSKTWGAVKLGHPLEKLPITMLLKEISEIREKKHSLEALKTGLQSDFLLVQRYCIRWLLKINDISSENGLLERLLRVRDDESRSAYLDRIPASRAYSKIQASQTVQKAKDMHRLWLIKSILESKTAKYADLSHLTAELVKEISDKSDLKNFSSRAIDDPQARAEVRLAIMDALIHPKFCLPESPTDAWTNEIFDKLIRLSSDPDNVVRARAIIFASRIARSTTESKTRTNRISKLLAVLGKAAPDESDEKVRNTMLMEIRSLKNEASTP